METNKYFHQQETNCNVFALLSRQKGGNNRPKQNKRDEYFFFLKYVYSVSRLFAAKERGKEKKGRIYTGFLISGLQNSLTRADLSSKYGGQFGPLSFLSSWDILFTTGVFMKLLLNCLAQPCFLWHYFKFWMARLCVLSRLHLFRTRIKKWYIVPAQHRTSSKIK